MGFTCSSRERRCSLSKDYLLYAGQVKFYKDNFIVDTTGDGWEGSVAMIGRGDSKLGAPYPPQETEEALFALEEGQKVEVIVRVL